MVKRARSSPARALILTAALVAAAAVVAVLVLGRQTSVPTIPVRAPLSLRASLGPSVAGFGDRVEVRIVVALNRRLVRPQTLRYTYSLAPLTSLGPARTTRSADGDLELVTVVQPAACVTGRCIAPHGPATLSLPPARATVARIDGGSETVSARWPSLSIRGRVAGSDLSGRAPRFAADTSPPPPTYRTSPSLLATVLDVVGVLCALGAVALLGWQAVVVARRRSRREVDALTRAVTLTREAQSLPVPQRRRAVGLLARLLGRGELSSQARDLAWSAHEPEPDELEALASAVERRRKP